ncbi:hypothetical protein QYF36_005235 [Acer negundo]|nr:hypothetical protein QYF36_005235 [Acer negundo]
MITSSRLLAGSLLTTSTPVQSSEVKGSETGGSSYSGFAVGPVVQESANHLLPSHQENPELALSVYTDKPKRTVSLSFSLGQT